MFHFLTRHLFIVFLVIIVLVIAAQFRKDNVRMPQLAPIPAAPVAKQSPQGVPIIEAVTKKENGDSDFATDTYALMTEPERVQYSRNFYYAMSNIPENQIHSWNFYNIAGSIRAGDTFANSEGVRCRHFSEVLKVHHVQQTITGSACEQGGGAWCKLRPNATPVCNIGASRGFLDSVSSSLGNLF